MTGLVAVRGELVDDVRADEAGAAGDERPLHPETAWSGWHARPAGSRAARTSGSRATQSVFGRSTAWPITRWQGSS